jgi:hypothetical protein
MLPLRFQAVTFCQTPSICNGVTATLERLLLIIVVQHHIETTGYHNNNLLQLLMGMTATFPNRPTHRAGNRPNDELKKKMPLAFNKAQTAQRIGNLGKFDDIATLLRLFNFPNQH